MRKAVLTAALVASAPVTGGLCMAAPAVAQDQSAAPILSLADIETRAHAGDPAAMVAYALALLDGCALDYDAATAAELASAAVGMGAGEAQLLLSVMGEHGIGLPPDPARAAGLLDSAAETGLPEALYHRAGKRAGPDSDGALHDLRRAGAAGHVPALQVLATLRNWEQPLQTAMPTTDGVTALADKNTGAASDTNVIIAIQAMLRQLDYQPGLPTGELTRQTTSAIRQYQSDRNLPADGQATVALRDHITDTLRQR